MIEACLAALGIPAERRRRVESEKLNTGGAEFDVWVGKELAPAFIRDFMSQIAAVYIFDGLDELKSDPLLIRQELSWFARNSGCSKILVSCRSGDYHGGLDGFDIVEICPLTATEAESIADVSGVSSKDFFAALSRVPYGDLANRPLFLAQLLFLYSRHNFLPHSPSEVYEDMVLLMLKEWDDDRGVTRRSKYSQFTRSRKLDFLAAIAYFLTFKIRSTKFTTADLQDAYRQIHVRFSLPIEEATAVAEEVESHTGLIVASGYRAYEFSHLSLQEYLCAEYMSREAQALHLLDYLEQYPAPVAICISIASDPSLAFASLFLRDKLPIRGRLESLIHRLVVERPSFLGAHRN